MISYYPGPGPGPGPGSRPRPHQRIVHNETVGNPKKIISEENVEHI